MPDDCEPRVKPPNCCPPRFLCLNTWSSLVVLFGKVVDSLAGEALMGEMGHWRQPSRFYSLVLSASLLLSANSRHKVTSCLIGLWPRLALPGWTVSPLDCEPQCTLPPLRSLLGILLENEKSN